MSYVYSKSTNQRAKFPVIVNHTKYIIPTSKHSPSRRQNKLKTTSASSKLSPLAIIDPLTVRDSHKKDMIRVDSPNSLKKSTGTRVNGHNRNGYYPYPYYNDRNNSKLSKSKSLNRNGNMEDDVHRVYIEDNSLNSSLLSSSSPNEKKMSERGSSAETDPDRLHHNHNHYKISKNISVVDGELLKHKYKQSSSHKKKNKNSKKSKKTAKQWQTFIMKRTLLVINIITLLLGVASLILAGIIDPQPLHRVGTTGAQVSLASIYVIFVSLVGLYGARLKNYHLLFIYAYCLIAELVIRSLIALIYVFFYHTGSRYFYSMISVIPEVALIFLSLAVALDIRQEQHTRALDSHRKTLPV